MLSRSRPSQRVRHLQKSCEPAPVYQKCPAIPTLPIPAPKIGHRDMFARLWLRECVRRTLRILERHGGLRWVRDIQAQRRREESLLAKGCGGLGRSHEHECSGAMTSETGSVSGSSIVSVVTCDEIEWRDHPRSMICRRPWSLAWEHYVDIEGR
jgi:hypothetical protein